MLLIDILHILKNGNEITNSRWLQTSKIRYDVDGKLEIKYPTGFTQPYRFSETDAISDGWIVA